MLDPRIYRMTLVIPALALIVLAFSLSGEPSPARSSLAPEAFSGAAVARTMDALATRDPARTPGSAADARAARTIAHGLRAAGLTVSTDRFAADTVAGTRETTNVIATHLGTASGEPPVLVLAPRDGAGAAGASGSAMLLELARSLGGETIRRSVVLASISGAPGMVGARRLIDALPSGLDAAIVLGDVGSSAVTRPAILPWTGRSSIAPQRLRATLASALSSQAGLHTGAPGVFGELAHLAFPLTVADQAAFGERGIPAVELSLSGERGPRAGAAVLGAGRLDAIGRGVLSAVIALDGAATVTAPSSAVVFDRELVPQWAISLFVLALILPVAFTTIDGLARAGRRRQPLGRSLAAVISAACPFLAAAVVVMLGGALGAMPGPGAPVAAGVVGVSGGAIAVMALALLAALVCGLVPRVAFAGLGGAAEPAAQAGAPGATPPPAGRRSQRLTGRPGDGPAMALLAVLCAVAIVLWAVNPFAAALLVPALHLWLWAIDSDLALPAPARLLMVAVGAVPTIGLVLYYSRLLGFGPAGLAWEAVLLLSGHVVSWVAVVEWSLVLGCLGTAVGLILAEARRPEPVAPALTVRGPASYAGPGSLGGTKSAIRR